MEITKIIEKDALYYKYPMCSNRQKCYLELDFAQESVTCDWNAETGNGIPMDVYHGHCQRLEMPCLIASAANELMEEILPLAEAALAGYSSEWDGHNYVAEFTDAAKEALDEIALTVYEIQPNGGNSISDCDAGDYLNSEHGVTADMTDEELEALAESHEDQAMYDFNVVLEGAFDYLFEARKELQDDQCE